jgi:hypothetical protein
MLRFARIFAGEAGLLGACSRFSDTLLVALMFGVLGAPVSAQPPRRPAPEPVKQEPGETTVPGQCLTKEELDLIARLEALKRPTVTDDAPKPFNPHYFIGTWRVEGDVPDSPLGSAGPLRGVETIRRLDEDDCTYESTMQAKGADGPFTVKSTMVYDPKVKYLVRIEQDSRGFQLLKIGSIGGDLGGYFTYYWQAPQITYKGKRLRVKGTTFLASPSNYRVRLQISADGQALVNAGTLWWRREDGQR